MNAFSISLTVKSLISFFIIIFYFEPVLPDALKTLWMQSGQIQDWLISDSSSSLG
jgi:type III secretion protein T